MRLSRVECAGAAALLALVAGCARPASEPPAQDGLALRFETTARPEVFRFEGPGMRIATSSPGLWAAVPDLPRPESAEAVNLATEARVTLALFAGSGGGVQLSEAAAEALGIAPGAQAPVRVTALRREPRLVRPQ